MGCELHPKVVYTQFSALVKQQKEILQALIRDTEPPEDLEERVFPGIGDLFKGGPKEIPIEDIPGVR